jgi:glycosyltransferase involved in cell wall biosynthesis
LKNPHLNFHWTFIWNSLIQLPSAVQKAFEALRIMDPDIVLTCEMASSNVRVFTEAAKKRRIVAVDCPHGYVGDIEEFEPHGDLYLAWGQETVKQLSQRFKTDNAPIVVTGSPVNERVIKSQPGAKKQQLYEETGFSPSKKTICIVTNAIFGNIWPVQIKEFMARCDEIVSLASKPGVQIIIKVSPRIDHIQLYKNIFKVYKNIYVCSEYTLDELLPIVDMGIMFYYLGTASFLFMHKDIPTIFVRNKNTVASTDIAWQILEDNRPLSELCDRFLYDGQARQQRLMLQKQFAEQHLHIDAGNAAQRGALTMKDALRGSRKPTKRTRRRREILTPPPQTEPGQIGCLAIFTPQVGKVSETFITRQINNLAPDRTVVVTAVMNAGVRMQHPCLVTSYSTSPSVYHAEVEERVVRFLQEYRVTHILCQYGCYGADIIELNHRYLHLPVFVHFLGGDASLMLRDPGMCAYYKWMGTRVTGVIALSEKMASRLASAGIPPQKIRVIQHGVDIPLTIEARPDKQPCRFVSVTRLVPKKAPLLLLQAFKKVRDRIGDCTLDIIGDGPLRQNAQQFIDSYGLNNVVTLHGDQPHERMMAQINDSCIYVQHSITDPQTGNAEGLPHVILEASAAGLPIVSTLHEGIPDEVQHGVTGFLVEEGDVDAMADYMIKLAQSPNKRKTMGIAAHKKIAAEFTISIWMQRLRDYLTLSNTDRRLVHHGTTRPPQALTPNDKGKTLVAAGDKAGTLTALEKAVEDNPNSVKAHNNLGLLYHKTGDIRRAMQSFLNALKLDSTDNNTVTNICWLYKQMGWTKEAESLMRRCSQENLCNLGFSKEMELSNIMPQLNRKSDLKFSFIMIVLNGMPFIEYTLKSIYDFAHEIIIAELKVNI